MERRARIFITEDEGVIAMDLRRQLEEFGFEVVGAAACAEHALAGVAATRPDLVLMDVVIKGPLDGIAAAARMREKHDVALVFLSAYADDATLGRAGEAGAHGYLVKPLRADDLRATIEIALARHRSERALRRSERQFRSSFDLAPIAMALLDVDGRVAHANRALGEMHGCSAHALIGSTLDVLKRPQGGSAVGPRWRARLSVYALHDEGGAPMQLITFAQDVSERMPAAPEPSRLERRLRRALAQDEFRLHYQPIFRGGRVAAVEALLRWLDPEIGLVPPAEFMPLAEQSGLVVPIGAWVMRSACRQMRRWRDDGLSGLRVAVNLSARQFGDAGLVPTVAAALREARLEADALELELTEASVTTDPERAAITLRALRAMGVHQTVGDFGVGYSSLATLRRSPIDCLKLDRRFLHNVPGDADGESLIAALLQLASSLRMDAVAEGVETAAQAAYLRSLGCDHLQGFHLGRPGAPEEIAGLLAPRATGAASLAVH